MIPSPVTAAARLFGGTRPGGRRLLTIPLIVLVGLFVAAASASATGGDFATVDFTAAAPLTYDHETGGGAYNDRTVGKSNDIVESLEGSDFACGDTVTYLLNIEMEEVVVDPVQIAEFEFHFLADSTGQSGAALADVLGVSINYGQVENGDDGTGVNPGAGFFGLDSGIHDDRQTIAGGDTGLGGSTALLTGEFLTGPLFTAGSELVAFVQVDDLQAGESLILRIDVLLACQPGANPTGNLQAKLEGGQVIFPEPDVINTGAQTIPFLKIGQLTFVVPKIFKTVTTADGTCPGVEELTVDVGDTVKYCYAVTNEGADPLFDIEVWDDNATPGDTSDDFMVPLVGLTDEDGDGFADDLAPAAWAFGEALKTFTGAGTFHNVATITGVDDRGKEFSDDDDATVNVIVPADLVVDKTVTAGSCPGEDSIEVPVGATVRYCYVVTNPGSVPAFDVVLWDDNATPGDTTDDFMVPLAGLTDEDGDGFADDLAGGATATGEVTKLMDVIGTFHNTGTVSGFDGEGGPLEDTDEATVVVRDTGQIQLVKTVTTAGGTCPGVEVLEVLVGDTVKYCYDVTNVGEGDLFDVVVWDDNATPGDTTDDFMVPLVGLTDEDGDGFADDLAPGATAHGEALKVMSTEGFFTNTATATATDELGDPKTDEDQAIVEVLFAAIEIVKTVTTEGGTCPGGDSLEILAGSTVKYCYAVTATGTAPLFEVTVWDDNATPGDTSDDFMVPLAGLTDEDGDGFADDLAAGATAHGEVLKTFPSEGTFTNVAAACGDDGHGEMVCDTDETTVVVEIPPDGCIEGQLGIAGDFNLFVFEDVNSTGADTGGRLAAGRDAFLSAYAVGFSLPFPPGDSLVVGRDLIFNQGSVNGNVVYGNSASLNGVFIQNGTAFMGTPIDFAAEQAYLTVASAFWSTVPANGTTTLYWGQILLSGTDPVLNVFDVSGADLVNATYFQITAPAGSTVLINVDGTVDRMQYFGFSLLGGVTRELVLFNFFEATSLTLNGIGVEGSILAPLADVSFNGGVINGTLIAKSFSGGGEPHWFPFLGCLPPFMLP